MSSGFQNYRRFYTQTKHLENISSLLHWDMETMLPEKGREERGSQLSLLSEIIHERNTGNEFRVLVDQAKQSVLSDSNSQSKLRELEVLEEDLEKAQKLPTSFVTQWTESTARSQGIWAKAKRNSSFADFLPVLEELIGLAKKKADYLGYTNEPYDALLDSYEHGAKAGEIQELFDGLKVELLPLISKAHEFPNPFLNPIPEEKQLKFCQRIPVWLGLSQEVSRLDLSIHPFSTSLGGRDKRITTRIIPTEPLSSVFGVLHETGHSLYELGLSEMPEAPNPLTEFLSLGIHESQSRLWENQVGRSKTFWEFAYPFLLEDFGLKSHELPFDSLFRSVISAKRSKIRVEADPITYNIHIILRFELERGLINGSIQAKDLPELWNLKMMNFLGQSIEKDSEGVLQDIHWSMGGFGYFPTYTLGNLFGAQLFSAYSKLDPSYKEQWIIGDFSGLLQWLKKNLHHVGKWHSISKTIELATGETPHHRFLVQQLQEQIISIEEAK